MARNYWTILQLTALLAQSLTAGQAQKNAPEDTNLKLVVLEGRQAAHQTGQASGARVVVEVRDASERPVPNANVTFELPQSGPGGSFEGDAREKTVRSTLQGQAAMPFIRANDSAGRYVIRVRAAAGERTGSIDIPQSNSLLPVPVPEESVETPKSRSRAWKILAAVGGAAATGTILSLTRRSGRNSSTPAATPGSVAITPGAVSIGGPR